MATQNYPEMGTTPLPSGKIYPGMGSGVDENTFRPYNLGEMDATALYQEAWDESVKILNTLGDVFEKGMSDVHVHYANESISLPDSIGMSLKSGGANVTHTFPVLDPLLGTLIAGSDNDLVGNEMGQRLRYIQAYYAEMKAGVMTEQYGIEYNQNTAYSLYQKATDQLAKFYSENTGRMKRECLTQYYNIELNSVGSGVAGVGQHFNPNWYITNSTDAVATQVDGEGVPIWNSDKQEMANNIGVAMDAAATGTNGVDANISINTLDTISRLANARYVDKVDGKYCLVIPTPQWYKLSSLALDQMGDIWKSTSRYTSDEAQFPGEVGTYRDLRIIMDERWASAVVTESTGNYTFTFEYVQAGGPAGDTREKGAYTWNGTTGDRNWQVGWLMGKSAFIERVERDLFFKYEDQEYDKRRGIGAFMEAGYNLTVIRTDTENGTAGFPDYAENRCSAAIAFTPAVF